MVLKVLAKIMKPFFFFFFFGFGIMHWWIMHNNTRNTWQERLVDFTLTLKLSEDMWACYITRPHGVFSSPVLSRSLSWSSVKLPLKRDFRDWASESVGRRAEMKRRTSDRTNGWESCCGQRDGKVRSHTLICSTLMLVHTHPLDFLS